MDRQVLQQMIDQEAVLAEAARLGISATDAEVRERIVSIPAFQENGQFIGEQRYRSSCGCSARRSPPRSSKTRSATA